MLEAVVFFLIGVGLFSLFIAPLNLAVALGVETLNDLEERLISVVVAVLAVTFLQHFIRWEAPPDTLQFGAALALTPKRIRRVTSPRSSSVPSERCSTKTRSSRS